MRALYGGNALLLFLVHRAVWLVALLVTSGHQVQAFVLPATTERNVERSMQLFLFRRFRRKLIQRNDGETSQEGQALDTSDVPALVTPAAPTDSSNTDDKETQKHRRIPSPTKHANILIIGAGVSGLTAALQAANSASTAKVVVLEASPTVGGRVQSDFTQDGFILDRGFAVFLDAYPVVQQILDYETLGLKPLLPGALIKLPNRQRLARVSDPLRKPRDLIPALLAPIGKWHDKLRFVPLVWSIRTKSLAQLFAEPETTTQQALTRRWAFSDSMLQTFWEPFLEGVFLAPLDFQSSRMFTFVMKMFSEGSGCLPSGGMRAVSQQLWDKVVKAGAAVHTNQTVESIYQSTNRSNGTCYFVETEDGTCWQTDCLIIATDSLVAKNLLAHLDYVVSFKNLPPPVQRAVGCAYYSFKGTPPVADPILILNGCGAAQQRNTRDYPINNILFPSAVNPSYAPDGYSLCSVAILSQALEAYANDDSGLDAAVRRQLSTWFPEEHKSIQSEWKLERIYRIPNAQPGQLEGPYPANQNGGRRTDTYHGKPLPKNLYVCGDHMATASLNGAMESGLQAGKVAAERLYAKQQAL